MHKLGSGGYQDPSLFIPPDDRIGLPIAEARSFIDDGRPLVYEPPRVPTPAFGVLAVPLAVSVPPPQMSVELAAFPLVVVNMQVDGLMADGRKALQLKPF